MKFCGARYILYPSRTDVFRIRAISDVHYGNKACAVERLKKDLADIETDTHSYWVGVGDYAEYISRTDIRFDPEVVTENLRIADLGRLGKRLTDEVKSMFWPVRNKCLGLLYGNHELKYMKWTEQQDLHDQLCGQLEVPNLGYACMFDLCFVRVPEVEKPQLLPKGDMPLTKSADGAGGNRTAFRFYLHHGAGWAQTAGGKLNRLIQFMDGFNADIYIIGHVHDETVKTLASVGANRACTESVQQVKLGAIAGSYLRSYQKDVTTYAEQRGYRPVPIGSAVIQIEPDKRMVGVASQVNLRETE